MPHQTVYYLVTSCNRYVVISPKQCETWCDNRVRFMRENPLIAEKFRSIGMISNLSGINCTVRVSLQAVSL